MRPRAEHADLIASLRSYLTSIEGDAAPRDAEPPRRDTPGSRSATAARNVDDRNTGQATPLRGRSRRDSLSAGEKAVIVQAELLLKLLVKTTVGGPPTPGEESAMRSGGRRADVAGGWAP